MADTFMHDREENERHAYYVIECENLVGSSSYKEVGSNTEILIQTKPGLTNMSLKPCEEGWLGTTNSVYSYAHGKFRTFAEAEAYIEEHWPYHICKGSAVDYPADDQTWIYEDRRTYWSAYDWFDNNPPELTGDETNEEIIKLAEEIEEGLKSECSVDGYEVVVVGIQEYLFVRRDEVRRERDHDGDE